MLTTIALSTSLRQNVLMTWKYIAGFFDGEGTIAHLIVKKSLAEKTIVKLDIYLKTKKKQKLLKEKRIKYAKMWRTKGWSYRRIGRELNTDWGYIRRLLLYGGRSSMAEHSDVARAVGSSNLLAHQDKTKPPV